MPLLVLLFIAVPLIELAVIVYAAQAIGTPLTLVMLLVVSIVGAWLVKVEGLGVLRRFMATVRRAELPHRELVDGVLILMAGALMLTPGFVTDIVGLLFLFPPTRAAIRSVVIARSKAGAFISVFGAPGGAAVRGRRTVHDTEARDVSDPVERGDDPDGPPPGLTR